MQRELAKLQEGIFNTSFDQKSWETLTLGNRHQTKQSISFANLNPNKEAMSFTRNEEQEHRFLEQEERKQLSESRNMRLLSATQDYYRGLNESDLT